MALFALLACCGCVVGALARARSAEESVLHLAFTCAVVRGWQCETQSDMDVRAGIVDSAVPAGIFGKKLPKTCARNCGRT